ncbi:hypothetical protein QKW35_15965 [Pontibacterium granulatum]|uniref:hypothetical protein n=1 Tax=Pontibacterium granulatum TaxID=2036029 RepID=UPI00249AADFE|nr:hypothetical protein [Pontibacterium granulatum]MDI3325876.1 hypothetical protein [Pontibacterium granulatum]
MKRRTLVTGLLSTPLFAYLPPLNAANQQIELVGTLVNMPRNELQPWIVKQIRDGRLRKPELIKALLSAGVSHIEPRPVGFKYHAVLMVDAVRRMSLEAEGIANWIPILWNVDYFKHSQARSRNISDWHLENARSELPTLAEAPAFYTQGMRSRTWLQADTAITRLARSGSMHQVFELMLEWAVRDFHSIGHKAILLAGVWRSLEYSGWQDIETILRGTSYALLADGNVSADQEDGWWVKDYPENLLFSEKITEVAFIPGSKPSDTEALVDVMRKRDSRYCSEFAVERIAKGMNIQALWDAVFLTAADSVMNRPNIPMLHCITVSHALHSLWQRTSNPAMRRVIPLQAISYVVQMKRQRPSGGWNDMNVLALRPEAKASSDNGAQFDALGDSIGYAPDDARALIQAYPLDSDWWKLKQQLNTWLLYKSNRAHDFKYGAAVLETMEWLSSEWRTPYLAACSRLLMGSNMPDSVEGQQIETWLGGAFS